MHFNRPVYCGNPVSHHSVSFCHKVSIKTCIIKQRNLPIRALRSRLFYFLTDTRCHQPLPQLPFFSHLKWCPRCLSISLLVLPVFLNGCFSFSFRRTCGPWKIREPSWVCGVILVVHILYCDTVLFPARRLRFRTGASIQYLIMSSSNLQTLVVCCLMNES